MIYIGKNLVGKDWIDNTDGKLKKFSPVDGKLIAEFPAATIPVVEPGRFDAILPAQFRYLYCTAESFQNYLNLLLW